MLEKLSFSINDAHDIQNMMSKISISFLFTLMLRTAIQLVVPAFIDFH